MACRTWAPECSVCTTTVLAIDDFSHSVVYRQIFGLVEALGETRVTLRQLNSRCGPLTSATTPQIQSLLDFQGPAELAAPLAANN